MLKSRRAGLLAAACLLASAASASAETLADAVALAYATNPNLQSQRARLRALDENYVQARAGYRPRAEVGATAQYQRVDGTFDSETDSLGANLQVSQPLYTGGRVSNQVSAVEADILSAREQLRDLEQNVLLTVIQAYADVIRDAESLRIREVNEGVLRRQLEESNARFEVGEITRTDVAQSESRLAASVAATAQARAQLAISRTNYAAVVGQNPGQLAPLPALAGVPATVDAAFDASQEENPDLRAAELTELASRRRVTAAKAESRPNAAVNGSFGYGGPISSFNASNLDRSLSVSATVSQPLYAGGLIRSGIRQALQTNNADLIAVESQRRETLRLVSTSWQQRLASRASVLANAEQVRAARIAAEGVREEQAVGLRTVIEVLNAELELRNAELSVANSARDDYVSTANLLASVGRLGVVDVLPGTPEYDPAANFERVKRFGATPLDRIPEALDRIGDPRPEPTPAVRRATADEEAISTAD